MNPRNVLAFTEEKLSGLVEIVKIVEVTYAIDVDPDEVNEDELVILPGKYALDNQGRIWRLMDDVTNLFSSFGVDDPQARTSRGEVRQRDRDAKKRKPVKQ